MKQSFQYSVLLLFILVLVSNIKISARLMATKQGQEEVINLSQTSSADSIGQMESSESVNQLMGLEACDDEDEECSKRRMMAEAHLDYIYTQHHKP